MRRLVLPAISLVGGVMIGALLMLAAQSQSSETEAGTTVTTTGAPTMTSPPVLGSTSTTVAPISDQVLVVWTSGGLPSGLSDRLSALPGVTAVTPVRSGLAHLVESTAAGGETVDLPPAGMVIPLEVMAFDPATYPAFLPHADASSFAGLAPGQVLLGSTSAKIRRLGPGGVITFEGGASLEVVAIVDDVLLGAAEMGLALPEADLVGVEVERYLLIRYSGDRHQIEASIREELRPGVAVRIRAPGETPVLRHGDAVLPQVYIKEQFGEFAFRPGAGQTFEIDPDWVEASIVSFQVPLLGRVNCHRNLLTPLTGAMDEIEARGLGFLIDTDGFRGCYNPRYIANGKGISRHAWGVAVDVNMGANPQGLESVQDPRLIAIMERWGFTSGHEWLVPDPGHFEYLRPPPLSSG